MLFPLVYKHQQQAKYSENLYTLKLFVRIITDCNSTQLNSLDFIPELWLIENMDL